jgi:hypothetical protein
MAAARIVSGLKIIVGLGLAALASIAYAMAFAYSHPALVYGAMGACFLLLTLPGWFGRSRRSPRWLLGYYGVVVALLVATAFARFPMEALLDQA